MNKPNAIQKLLDAGLTRGDIAEAVGCTRAAISHYESGRSLPGSDRFAAICALAEKHGVVLFASDFVAADQQGEAA